MKKKLIQHLQILVLILIFLILSMKLWIQIMPDSESWIISDSLCDTCTDEPPSLPLRILKKYKNKNLNDYDGNLQDLEEIQYNHYYHEDKNIKNHQHDDNDHDIDKTFTAANDFESSEDDHDREQPKDFYIPPFKHKINDNIHDGDDNEQLITAYDYDFTVVTGASKNHFCPLKSFLYNMNTELRDYRVHFIVYDLGFSKDQVIELGRLKEQGFLSEYRKFNYSYYPNFFNITKARGEYAWKPAIIAELARDYPGLIMTWLDSGTFADKSYFRRLKSSLKYHKGFLSPRSSGFMKTWTHPGVYDYYNETDRRKYDTTPNCNGAVMSLDTNKAQKLIDSWYRCALVKDCIAPKGSSRLNHRQDQAIITYLAAKEKIFCRDKKKDHGVITHQDRFCKRYIAKFEKNLDNLKNNLK